MLHMCHSNIHLCVYIYMCVYIYIYIYIYIYLYMNVKVVFHTLVRKFVGKKYKLVWLKIVRQFKTGKALHL